MKKIIKTIAAILTLALVLGITSATTVSAVSTQWPCFSTSAYAESYCRSTGNDTPVYTSSSLSTRGTSSPYQAYNATIYASDVIQIFGINSSYAYISYPTGSGLRYGYISIGALTLNNMDHYQATARGKATIYNRPGGASWGYFESGDTVIGIATSGNYTQCFYSARSGNRSMKLGWVLTSDFSSYVKVANNNINLSLNVPLFKQTDSRWSGTYIGTKTIAQVGCTTTCIAMMYSYKYGTTYPNTMRNKLTYSNNDLYWSSATSSGAISGTYSYSSLTQSVMQTIVNQLKANKPVLLGSKNLSGGQHWVVITGYSGSAGSFSTASFRIHSSGLDFSLSQKDLIIG